MGCKKTTINIFISFAFKPGYGVYKKDDFEATFRTLFEDVENDLKEHNLEINPFFEITDNFGKKIPNGIIDKINQADFAIVDISINNPNVLYELGGLTMLNKENFIIKKEVLDGGKILEIPTDIDRNSVFQYEDIQHLVTRKKDSSLFYKDIKKRIVKKIKENDFYFNKYFPNIWFPINTKEIVIIVPPDEPSVPEDFNKVRLDNFADRDALLHVWGLLHRFYPETNVSIYNSKDDIPDDVMKKNLILIGGPGDKESANNKWTKMFMEEISGNLKYNDSGTSMLFNNKEYTPEINREGLNCDFGYFGKYKNPFNGGNRVVFLQGIYTHGVYGSALAFSNEYNSRRNYKAIEEFINENENLLFEVLFSVRVRRNVAVIPEIEKSLINIL